MISYTANLDSAIQVSSMYDLSVATQLLLYNMLIAYTYMYNRLMQSFSSLNLQFRVQNASQCLIPACSHAPENYLNNNQVCACD